MRVFTPCADAGLRSHSAAALTAFHARQWDGAAVQLQAVLGLQPQDPAALRLLDRIAAARGLPADAPWSPAVALDKL